MKGGDKVVESLQPCHNLVLYSQSFCNLAASLSIPSQGCHHLVTTLPQPRHTQPCHNLVTTLPKPRQLMNPLPERSNYSPLCHTHYLTLDQYFTSLFRPDPLQAASWRLILQSSMLQHFTAESSRELSALRKLLE